MTERQPRPGFVVLAGLTLAAMLVGALAGFDGLAPRDAAALGDPVIAAQAAPTDELAATGSVRLSGAFQLSQPRDPFRPLITPGSPATGIPGVGVGGDVDPGFDPGLSAITLIEIRDVDGVLRATVEVNGTTYDVGVGDTFAGSYLVVSLTEDSGVFTFGDTAFELGVGQQILK